MTTQELKEYILRQLGSPKVNVEVTEDQLQDAIDNAIYELQPWLSIRKYITVNNSQCIDMTPYNAINVVDVQEVLGSGSTNSSESIFNIGSNGYLPRSDNIALQLTPYNTNIHTYATNYSRARRESLYSTLSSMVNQRTQNTMNPHKSFQFIDDKLYVYCNASKITIEYNGRIDKPEDLSGNDMNTRKFIKYLKDLSVAFTQIIQARITGKYQDNNSPIKVDSDRIEKGAQTDIDRIREELRHQSNKFFISD